MNVDKAELKIAIATDIGATIEDSLEAAKKEMQQYDGAIMAFAKAAKACELLASHVDKDLDEGKYGLETAEIVKRYIERSAQVNRTLCKEAENLSISASGKISAFENAVATINKYREAERLKVISARVMEPSPGMPIAEDRPGLSIKQRRLLEEAETELVAETAPTEPAPPINEQPLVVSVKKKRGRPAKNVEPS